MNLGLLKGGDIIYEIAQSLRYKENIVAELVSIYQIVIII
jgi:hypothetical protein